ncbi:MAG TPA: hypothetical protein VGI19_06240 [Candidatus Cybelea sp.]|jgi:hypothetical protein
MVRSLERFVSCIAIMGVALVAIPGRASAQEQPTSLHFSTAITQIYGSQYPITGKLELEIFPGGHLRGFYHTSFYKLNIPVVGGRDGDYIWFDIGPSTIDLGLGAGPEGKLHVVATMNSDGSFKGQVYPETAAVVSGTSMQNFIPQPTDPSPNDQYIFAASPSTDSNPQTDSGQTPP